ncbi:hypothetical protein BDM02DRAFT_3183514 [Thelephora ganbajun]|uniref:Uncharacterized protein n=1 Tax=Thelephora ganbajun TaxID=370292 RepID=A0ACB6ZTM4_THEGA|nr:hypothetical protein BDM02DRAFT_3183514 [Thelephora ganbajun]
MSQVTRAGLLVQIASLESSLIRHRAESTQEVSNFWNTHVLSLAEKQIQVSELESSPAVTELSLAELQEKLQAITLSMEDERDILQLDISSLVAPQNAKYVTEAQQSVPLADALEGTNGRVQKAEKEIVIMVVEKKADEEAIQRLTMDYSTLRKLYVECLAEMDGLMDIIRDREPG